MELSQLILLPFSVIYNSVTTVRNKFYDYKVIRSYHFSTDTICVGNLRVGGTGKTPFVDKLITYYVNNKKIAILSRGYGRKTKGYFKADHSSTAQHIGDEPLQYYLKHSQLIDVYVDEDRVHGIISLTKDNPQTNLIILDDAFQHRALKSKVNILLSEYSRPFFKDYILPAGRLRESRKGAQRGDIIIITKCPEKLTSDEAKLIEAEVKKYAGNNKPVFFTKIKYLLPVSAFSTLNHFDINKNYVIVSAIDNPDPFIKYCKSKFQIDRQEVFPDHHNFTENEIAELIKYNLPVITTEKDIPRFQLWQHLFINIPVFYVPIEIEFLFNGSDLFFPLLNSKL